jgi:hypothetical protein
MGRTQDYHTSIVFITEVRSPSRFCFSSKLKFWAGSVLLNMTSLLLTISVGQGTTYGVMHVPVQLVCVSKEVIFCWRLYVVANRSSSILRTGKSGFSYFSHIFKIRCTEH